jgi:hypothetical protein
LLLVCFAENACWLMMLGWWNAWWNAGGNARVECCGYASFFLFFLIIWN